MANIAVTDQQALPNNQIIPSTPAVSDATAQLLNESNLIQSGQVKAAVASSETYNAPKPAPAVITSALADTMNTENQNTLNTYTTQLEAANTANSAATTRTTTSPTPTVTAPGAVANPLQPKIDASNSAIDAEFTAANNLLSSRMASLDAANQAAIQNIQRVFAARREETKTLNNALVATNTQAGIRAGRQRYAPEVNAGIITGIEQDGLARLSALDAQEASLITQAQAASDAEEFGLLSTQLNLISQTRKDKDQAIKDLNAAAIAEEDRAWARYKEQKELAKYEREDASASIDAMVQAGLTSTDVSQEYLAKLDTQAGYVPGTSLGLMDMAVKERGQLDAAEEIVQATALNTLLRDLPVGETITIGGTKYNSLNTGTVQISSETDTKTGDTFKVSFNEDTNEVTKTFVGNFGGQDFTDILSKEGAVVRVLADGTSHVMFDPRQPNGGTAQGGLISLFPEGSVSPFTRPNDPTGDRATECGAYYNDTTAGPRVGDSFASKMAITDDSITAASARIGDTFVQEYGSTGHIGYINGKTMVDGKIVFTVTESNWEKKPGTNNKVGLITHTRQVGPDEIAGFGRHGFGDSAYNFGTDAPDLEGLTFGEGTAADKPPEIQKINGRDYQYDATTQSWIDPATGQATTEQNPALDNAKEALRKIEILKAHSGFNNAVGQSGLQRFSGVRPGRDTDFIGYVQELINTDVLDQLIAAKANGATFGALSDAELQLLKTAANRIAGWAIEKDGKVVGYKVNQKTFTDALKDVESKYNDMLVKAGGGSVTGDSGVEQYRSQLQTGEILVKKSDGSIVAIPSGEFDASKYTKI